MWTLVNVFFHVTIGIAIALVLNAQEVWGRRFYRTLFLIPWGMPALITGLIWNNMWQKNGGGLNLLAESLNNSLGTESALIDRLAGAGRASDLILLSGWWAFHSTGDCGWLRRGGNLAGAWPGARWHPKCGNREVEN